MRQIRKDHPFKTRALVIMPDHLHCIWELPENDDNFCIRWQKIKSNFTNKVKNKNINLSKNKQGEYNLWQRRFWEHFIRDEKDLVNHIHYIHYNPVKHGLVKRVADWPYSSFHRYVQEGLLTREWGSDQDEGEFGE